MKRVRRAAVFILAFLSVAAISATAALALTAPKVADLPPLKDGDLVFQTTLGGQSLAVMLASGSLYTHTGIIKLTESGPVVIEASSPVRRTPLQRWIDRGVQWRLAIRRIRGLAPEKARQSLAWAERQYGKPYDSFFLPGDDRFYCSELVHDAFAGGPGLQLGATQKVSALTQSAAMDEIIAERWQSYPLCAGKKDMTFEKCRTIIMDQELVTPASLARDPQTEQIYSNYPADI